jgi:hypothetical protein
MNIPSISIKLDSPAGRYVFTAKAHCMMSPSFYHLDPERFYMRTGGEIPKPPHFELEVVTPGLATIRTNILHVHVVDEEDEVPFICWPKRIPTLTHAIHIFQIWSVGSLAKMVAGVDLNTVFSGECGEDAGKYFRVMEDRYGVRALKRTSA